MSKLFATKRAKAAIAGVMALATASAGGVWYAKAPDGKQYPAAVVLAVEKLIKPWEGLVLKAHWDAYGKVWDICYGETKGVRPGMVKTRAECDAMLMERVYRDYYLPIMACAPPLQDAPVSVAAAMTSGAYNFGVGTIKPRRGWCGWSVGENIRARNWRGACEAQTRINTSGGVKLDGLVRRREMGDAQRIGEGELCVSGLEGSK
ncbi:Lysozyme [uncultured Pleomorphomonas sp.]|uniref:Lysozyme n=1 Tax=uncultured Pleomorphomonas sp. TaxID=442121 RepID=A0A212L6W6_9HYPH|nr:lysozyme [uncultured Pleomorphomonas sp.]SCM73322.1 Lysozyme [uncultured Pleomorphomonas sp.]